MKLKFSRICIHFIGQAIGLALVCMIARFSNEYILGASIQLFACFAGLVVSIMINGEE